MSVFAPSCTRPPSSLLSLTSGASLNIVICCCFLSFVLFCYFFYQLYGSEDHHPAIAAAIQQVPPDWKRPIGRPSHTWLRTIEADLDLWTLASRLTGERPLLETNGNILWTQQRSSGVCETWYVIASSVATSRCPVIDTVVLDHRCRTSSLFVDIVRRCWQTSSSSVSTVDRRCLDRLL